MRSVLTHTWPALRKVFRTANAAAASRSASPSTTSGSLPPSSRITRFRPAAASCMMRMPVARLPVKTMRSTSASTSARPTSPAPCTTCSTSAGKCLASVCAQRSAHSGVSSLGFRMTVLPATSAGSTLWCGMSTGKFHGVMATHTPKASWCSSVRVRLSSRISVRSASTISSTSSASELAQWLASPRPSAIGLPISSVASSPMRLAADCRSSAAARTMAARASRVSAAHAGCAARARATACPISAGLAACTEPTAAPVAGLEETSVDMPWRIGRGARVPTADSPKETGRSLPPHRPSRYTFPSLNMGRRRLEEPGAAWCRHCGMTACSSLESAAARVIPVRARTMARCAPLGSAKD